MRPSKRMTLPASMQKSMSATLSCSASQPAVVTSSNPNINLRDTVRQSAVMRLIRFPGSTWPMVARTMGFMDRQYSVFPEAFFTAESVERQPLAF
jgi:hypothetical protein